MLVALGGSALGTLAFALAVIRPEPWWSPRYAIPLLGMLLGNSLSAVSLALDSLLKSLRGGLPLLAFGATRAEATQGAVAAALQTGTTSIVNTLNVVGLVTIPGMMTGQVLGGAAPPKAASYQVLILALILCTTFLAALGASLLATRAAFDGAHPDAGAARAERAGDADGADPTPLLFTRTRRRSSLVRQVAVRARTGGTLDVAVRAALPGRQIFAAFGADAGAPLCLRGPSGIGKSDLSF